MVQGKSWLIDKCYCPINNYSLHFCGNAEYTGGIKIDVRLKDETVWLTQKLMAKLFQTTVPNINMYLKGIYKEGELKEKATIKDFLIVQKVRKKRALEIAAALTISSQAGCL